MVNVFSYCIYGKNPKYLEGLVVNLRQIAEKYPEFETWIVVGSDIPPEYLDRYRAFPQTKITEYPFTGGRLMSYRFLPIDNPIVDCMIVRDADSRFTDRDVECIQRFQDSPYLVFTIRDHYYHRCPIMGGQWGVKRLAGFNVQEKYTEMTKTHPNIDAYDSDQYFLRHYIYPTFGSQMIAFVSVNYRFAGTETIAEITPPRKNEYDFCGNVFEFNAELVELVEYPCFKYWV